jgi:hypothetical protein
MTQKRPKLISFVAGWLVVCSVVGVVVFSAVIPTVDAIQTEGEQAQWIADHLGRVGLLIAALGVYAFAGATGVGLWRLRLWGRMGILLASGALVLTSVVVCVLAVLRQHSFDVNALILAIVFGWPLYYFNRPTIKSLFT